MPTKREGSIENITVERAVLRSLAEGKIGFDTEVPMIGREARIPNTVGEDTLGIYRTGEDRKAVIADIDLLGAFGSGDGVPSFLEAGPRRELRHDPQRVRAAIVTTGGIAPGLHCVIHSIVKRHCHTYSMVRDQGKVYGVYDSFRGLCNLADSYIELDPGTTEEWLYRGGSKLGNIRYRPKAESSEASLSMMVEAIGENLRNMSIDILYVIGGDGSLMVAHRIAEANPALSVVGIPKTMDNDILWVWQSFGFNTAVERATGIINNLHREAESTRRIGLIELFGAESGFVAANAALASGHVDLVLVPEVFNLLDGPQAEVYLETVTGHLKREVNKDPHNPHAIVVIAEGVGTFLESKGAHLSGERVTKGNFLRLLDDFIGERVVDSRGERVLTFENQPRHYIRSVPANPYDHIYCERLGALAVDNALAGYSDFMISQWLTEYVLVPLRLVELGKKSIPVNGMFWKQVVSSTGQPLSPAERLEGSQ